MKKLFEKIAILLVTTVVMLIFMEIVLQFLPVADPFEHEKTLVRYIPRYIPSSHRRDYQFTSYMEEDLSGVDAEAVFSTNSYGYRGDELLMPKPKNEFRIFMVGGSTTECLILNDDIEICRVLQQNLNEKIHDDVQVKVYNAGKSGDRIFDHTAMISQRIVQLDPDMVILFSGVNDLAAGISGFDYLHYQSTSNVKASYFRQMVWIATELQLPRRLYNLYNVLAPKENIELITSRTNYRQKVDLRRSKPLSDEIPRVNLSPYEGHLRTIVGIGAVHDFKVLFMTQATSWNSNDPETEKWHWMSNAGDRQLREDLLDSALEKYNDSMRQVGEEMDVQQ
jgi:lysophospholipase L1-like esterase